MSTGFTLCKFCGCIYRYYIQGDIRYRSFRMCYKHQQMLHTIVDLQYIAVPVQYFYDRCLIARGPQVHERFQFWLEDPQVQIFSGYSNGMVCRNKVDNFDFDLLF